MTFPNQQDSKSSVASEEVNRIHDNDDLDFALDSHHHSLGYGATQAAPGDHDHPATVHNHDTQYLKEHFDFSTNASFSDPVSSYPARVSVRYMSSGVGGPTGAGTWTTLTVRRSDTVAFQITMMRSSNTTVTTPTYFRNGHAGGTGGDWSPWVKLPQVSADIGAMPAGDTSHGVHGVSSVNARTGAVTGLSEAHSHPYAATDHGVHGVSSVNTRTGAVTGLAEAHDHPYAPSSHSHPSKRTWIFAQESLSFDTTTSTNVGPFLDITKRIGTGTHLVVLAKIGMYATTNGATRVYLHRVGTTEYLYLERFYFNTLQRHENLMGGNAGWTNLAAGTHRFQLHINNQLNSHRTLGDANDFLWCHIDEVDN